MICPLDYFLYLVISDLVIAFRQIKMETQTKQKSHQLLLSTHMTFVWIRLLEDIYIVKEIAGKCHTELTDFDRAVRNAVFFFYWLAFWSLEVKWISLICLYAGCSMAAFAFSADSFCSVLFCKIRFLWQQRREEGHALQKDTHADMYSLSDEHCKLILPIKVSLSN